MYKVSQMYKNRKVMSKLKKSLFDDTQDYLLSYVMSTYTQVDESQAL